MTRSLYGNAFVVAAILSAFSVLGCNAGGVGDPCIPEDEYVDTFSAYSAQEVNIESRSFQCESRVCLVNHFQGRVSCPYGQTDTSLPGDNDAACRIPGTKNEAIKVTVAPQIQSRQTDDAVYCSCRCANADGQTNDGKHYCGCPGGFHCAQLIDDLKIGSSQLAGGYCVRNGTDWKAGAASCINPSDAGCCDRNKKNCGKAQPYGG